MSVKLVYDAPLQCPLIQEIGGYCYCRPNVNSKPRLKEKFMESKIVVDFADYPDSTKNNFPIELKVDFGLVPVESMVFRQIHFMDTSSLTPLKTLTVRPWKSKTIDRAFRIIQSNNKTTLDKLDAHCQMKVDTIENDRAGAGDCKPLALKNRSNNIKIRLVFEPELPTMNYCDVFLVLVDNKSIRLECRGLSEGPSVCFSENVLNFGGQYYKDESRLWFKMINSSGCEAQFQFDNDNTRSTFRICPTSGVVPAFMALTVEVLFQAPKPQTFYKRVLCLLHHQQPQYIDLIGICIPRPFFSAAPIDFCVTTTESRFLPFPTESNDEYFDSHHFWGINFSREMINFGFQNVYSKGELSESTVLSVTSVLPYDVIIEWFQDPLEIFLIHPQTCILQSKRSAIFEVQFQPNFPDTFYSGLLECFVYPTGQLWSSSDGPPWEFIMRKQNLQKTDTQLPIPIEYPVIPQVTPTIVVDSGDSSGYRHDKTSISSDKSKGKGNGGEVKPRATTAMTELTTETNIVNTNELSSTDVKVKGKNIKQKKGVRLKETRSTPVVLPSLKEDKELEKVKDLIRGSLTALHKSALFQRESVQKEPSISERQPSSSLGANMRTFPLQVTIQHAIGGIKRSLHLDPIQDNDSIASELYDTIENTYEDDEGIYRDDYIFDRKLITPQRRQDSHFNDKTGGGEAQIQINLEGEVLVLDPQAGHEVETDSTEVPQELAIPLCLILRVNGHTFGNHTLIPHYKVPKKITMIPTWPQNKICRSFILKNRSDLPLYYDVGIVEGDGVYRVKPQIGIIPGNFHQIILVSMFPKVMEPCLYVHNCLVEFNFSDKNLISLRGIAELPTLDVVICYSSNINESEIVCPETVPGCGSDTYIEFVNTSRFHYRYAISSLEYIEEADLGVFTPTPPEGIIAPYETVRIKWRFVPNAEEAYFMKWKAHFNVLRARTDRLNSSTYYELPITLAGVGRNCVLEAMPNNLKFEMVEIFKEKEMFFSIYNRSNAVVTADLRVMHEEWLQWYMPLHIRINPTSVTLSGSESAMISVIVRPDHTNFQKYYVEYAIELTEHEGQEQTTGFMKLCDISFIGDHTIFKVTDIMMIDRHPIWDAGQCWSMFSLDNLNEYLKPIRNTAKEGLPPNIPSVAFRFPPAPVGSDPAIVTILLSNNEQLGGYWDLHTLPPKEWAKKGTHFKKDEDTSGVYNGSVKDNKQMLNLIWTRKLTGSSLNSYVEKVDNDGCDNAPLVKDIECHNIVGRPEGQRRPPTIAFGLKDIDFFKISPMRGSLKSRESQQISFRYSYKTIGHHHMNVLVRVHPAIFIWIELLGTTLKQNEPYIQLIHQGAMQFHPVCLSDMDPPIQMFWIFNGGNAPSTFKIDMEPFQQLKKDNFDHEVFECLSEDGIIPPRSWAPVLIRFSPLELLEYSIPLNIYSENRIKRVILKGQAVLTPTITLGPDEQLKSINHKHQLIDPLVPITISPTHITFTHIVPTGQKSTSIVFLTNLSSKNKISFTWPDIEIEGGGSITFIPDSGIIRAKEQATIKVIVQAGSVATIFSRMIRCSMVDESSLAKFDLMIKIWNSHMNVLVNTMSKEEAEARLAKKFNGKPIKPPSFSRVLSVKVFICSVFGLLDTVIPREQARMPFSDNICRPLRKNHKLTLLPFGRQLCQGILSDIIWDLVNSASFSSYVKRMSKHCAPFYYEYKSSEMQTKMAKNGKMKRLKKPLVEFPRQSTQDVLEQVIFNMIQEVAEDFYPGKTKHTIRPVQPQELIDIKKYRRDFL